MVPTLSLRAILPVLVTIGLFTPLTWAKTETLPVLSQLHCQAQLSKSADASFQNVQVQTRGVSAFALKLIEEARTLHVHSDFKYLSDLREKSLSPEQIAEAKGRAQSKVAAGGRKAYVSSLLQDLFENGSELLAAPEYLSQALWKLADGSAAQKATVDYIEHLWPKLIKKTPTFTHSSLIPLPYPVIIPGGRFQESYYWDSYFGIQGLLRTGRCDLAAMQIENFLFMINTYGLVPNGMRNYYLSRSQPPLLSAMIRAVVEDDLRRGQSREGIAKWLRERAFPLVKKDYQDFWMNPKTHFDRATGLNHHWDSKNLPREERSGADNEEALAATYRDVRAEAESGKDFTDAFEGQATQIAPVLLNSILYDLEMNLQWMANFIGQTSEAETFLAAASRRRTAINKYLWDPTKKSYFDYKLATGKRGNILTADIFVPMWARLASPEQAQGVHDQLRELEAAGGVLASTKNSGKQWDSPFVWAPQQYFAIDGLRRYGFNEDAKRIARKFTGAIDKIHSEIGAVLEKIDGIRADRPQEPGNKYYTQEGFLWTNSVYLWAMTDVLGFHLVGI